MAIIIVPVLSKRDFFSYLATASQKPIRLDYRKRIRLTGHPSSPTHTFVNRSLLSRIKKSDPWLDIAAVIFGIGEFMAKIRPDIFYCMHRMTAQPRASELSVFWEVCVCACEVFWRPLARHPRAFSPSRRVCDRPLR